MIVHAHKQPITAEEFFDLDHKGFELVDGRMVEKNMGMFSNNVEMWIFMLIFTRFDWRKYGYYFGAEAGYQCWPDHTDRVRKPDISFIRAEKLAQGKLTQGWSKVPPDFAVEVMSKNDTLPETEEKVSEYLEVGVPLIWVVDPKRQVLRVYRGSLKPAILSGQDEVSDPTVLPDFRCFAEELFPDVEAGE